MTQETLTCDIAVIGAGAGGLVVAAATALLGRSAVLIERDRMGGDCLNVGCVPSKALIAAARHAHGHHESAVFGIEYAPPRIDFGRVMAHVQQVIAGIAPNDSVARYEAMGVTVLQGEACFTGPDELSCNGRRIRARRIVIATGSRPAVPAIEGLSQLSYLTNETLFGLQELPQHLLIIGGGAVGSEMAQAFRRLGSEVSIIEQGQILGAIDPELRSFVRSRFQAEGITLHEGADVARALATPDGPALELRNGTRIGGSHLLVAAGRRPNTEALNLAAAGITLERGAIRVDAGLRTTNRRVYAIGDVIGGPCQTSLAGEQAGLVVRSALFRLPVRADRLQVPRAVFTDPEIAVVGLDEAEARRQHGDIRILRWPFSENDRARTEGRMDGLVKVILSPGGTLLGAGIVGDHAGDLIQIWSLALNRKLKPADLQAMASSYPTRSEASRRAIGEYYRPKLFSPLTRWLVALLARLG